MSRAPVLYVLRWYPTLTETFVYREIDALQRLGQPVIVVAMGEREPNPELPDVPVWKPGPMLVWRARRAGVRRVHAHFEGEASALAQRLADRLGVPFSVTVHAAGLFRPRAGIVARLRAASPVITVCQHHATWIAEHYGVSAEVVRCGVDIPAERVDPSASQRVVAVARDVPKKDLARLRAWGAAVIHSSSPPAVVRGALRSAGVFALPCRVDPLGNRDGVPVAMMEAMALGLPVVTRPVAGIPELVDDQVGWIDHDFERALDRALADPSARATRGAAARRRIATEWGCPSAAASLLACWG